MVISQLVLVPGINVFPSYFPEKWMEFITQPVLLHVVEHFDFIHICHKIGPYIIVDGDHHLTS